MLFAMVTLDVPNAAFLVQGSILNDKFSLVQAKVLTTAT
jgi:hypothetical protein